jgi:hypothetical protein
VIRLAFFLALVLFVVIFAMVLSVRLSASAASPSPATPTSVASAPETFQGYVARLAHPNSLVVADASASELAARDANQRRDHVAAILTKLQTDGHARAFTFDKLTESFAVELDDTARAQLAADPFVADVATASAAATTATSHPTTSTSSLGTTSTSGVSSVNFIQVYSPFMWGKASVGGLSVDLALLDPTGTITIGVPTQMYFPQPNPPGSIQIDRTQLYYETVFVDPVNSAHAPVMILPNDRVHVITSGIDPTTNQFETNDVTITVDDVQGWTSFENGSVSGTAPPNSTVVVTASNLFLSLSNYLTPGSNLDYAQVTANSAGAFSATMFQTSSNPTPAKITLTPGWTGFVRVVHSDGNEVYNVHGQNLFVLENSSTVHGYVFPLPSAPTGLNTGVTVTRPARSLQLTVANGQNQVLSTETLSGSLTPYTADLSPTMIVGGDVVTGVIDGVYTTTVATSPVSASVDIAGNQVTGTGPANTPLVIGVGQIDGYLTTYSTFNYNQHQVTTNSSGSFSSGTFACGSGKLSLQAGSFGYASYEDPHANVVYEDFAATRHDVMAHFPYVEGWVTDGTVRPSITIKDASADLLGQVTATPELLYLINQKLYINVYYSVVTPSFIDPGDTVSITAGSQTATIPVDDLTTYPNTDSATVVGVAPAGTTVLTVPDNFKTASKSVSVGSTGAYAIGNPFNNFADSTCSTTSWTETFSPGNTGRTYLTHADGNRVFAVWGRSLHVNENEAFLDLYLYPTQNLSWSWTPSRSPVTATVTLTPAGGSPVSVQCVSTGCPPDYTLADHAQVTITNNTGQKVIIRAGDSVSATFVEGVGSTLRPVTLTLSAIPLVTGSPDPISSTLAGVGPPSWTGQALLNAPPSANPVAIPARSITAYSPLSFTGITSGAIKLVQGYSGTVSFTDTFGDRVWSAWAVTAFPVRITSFPLPGQTVVCGTAGPNSAITILDVSTQPNQIPIGTGPADSQGNWCVTVSPPLYKLQVIVAEDGSGDVSQPVVVGGAYIIYLPSLPQ